MGLRRQAREAALQAIFMCDFLGQWDAEHVADCFEHFAVPKAARVYAFQLCAGVIENLVHIDSQLTCASENWSISRMGRVDRALLRMAAYEILCLPDIPVSVAINEAVEIAKRFGAGESPTFVNGVLDKVASVSRPRADLCSGIEIEVIGDQKSEVVLEEEAADDEETLVG